MESKIYTSWNKNQTKPRQRQGQRAARQVYTVQGHLSPWGILLLFLGKQVARPQHTQQRPRHTDLAAVGSTLSEAHSQGHNPSGLARAALYKLQLPCPVTLNLPNSHGTFLSQRNYKEAGIWNSRARASTPCFLFPCG